MREGGLGGMWREIEGGREWGKDRERETMLNKIQQLSISQFSLALNMQVSN